MYRYKRKWYCILLTFVFFFSCINPADVQAKKYSGKAGKHVRWTYNTKTKTLTFSGKGKMYGSDHWYNESWGDYDDSVWTRKFGDKAEKIVFKKGITNVGGSAFIDFVKLKKIKFSSTIKRIEDYSFMNCSRLKKINLPNNLKYIDSHAFSNCNIAKLKIPNSVKKIGYEAFSGNRVSSLTLPKKMTKIPNYMLIRNRMTHFTVPKNVKTIGKCALGYCEELENVKFNQNLETVGEESFYGCKKLSCINFNSGLKRIGEYAFGSCVSLNNLNLPSNLMEIMDNAFALCVSLEYIDIPSKVSKIGFTVFDGCYNLRAINFKTDKLKRFPLLLVTQYSSKEYKGEYSIQKICVPYGVKEIETSAFSCESLREIEISETVEVFDSRLFIHKETSSVSEIVIHSTNIEKIGDECFKGLPENCIIYVPADCVEKYTTLFRSGGLSEKVSIVALEQ